MSVCCALYLFVAVLMGFVLFWSLSLYKRPMTVTLRFDDGFKVHSEIAAPLLVRLGWRGMFNVPTDFMELNRKLSQEQLLDCCLEGHEDNLMTWDDVCKLLAEGHEVYPHTCGHVNLVLLANRGDWNEVRRQVVGSKIRFAERTGVNPCFFCYPHNDSTPETDKIVRGCGMEPVQWVGVNFGEVVPSERQASVGEYLLGRYRQGWLHTDIMMHGICRDRGGWRPFEDVATFESFLGEILKLEERRVVKIVPYRVAHRKNTALRYAFCFYDRVRGKCRRMFFGLKYSA